MNCFKHSAVREMLRRRLTPSTKVRNIRECNVIHDPFSVCRQFRDDALPRCTDIIGKNIRIRRAVEVLRKRGRRTARTRIQHQHIVIECLHILCDLFPALSLTFKIVPCRQIIPARSAGRLRVRSDDAHVLPEQIIPVRNVLRIVLAHQKNNRRCVRGTFLIKLILKTILNHSRIRNHLHIPLQCQRHHIRLQAVCHLKCLLAGTSVRLDHRHILPCLLLPVFRKQCIVRFIQFPVL